MSQISLAWMKNKDIDIVPIPGSTNPKYLQENFDSCKIALSREEVQEIDKMLDQVATGPVFKGTRN